MARSVRQTCAVVAKLVHTQTQTQTQTHRHTDTHTSQTRCRSGGEWLGGQGRHTLLPGDRTCTTAPGWTRSWWPRLGQPRPAPWQTRVPPCPSPASPAHPTAQQQQDDTYHRHHAVLTEGRHCRAGHSNVPLRSSSHGVPSRYSHAAARRGWQQTAQRWPVCGSSRWPRRSGTGTEKRSRACGQACTYCAQAGAYDWWPVCAVFWPRRHVP